jgi:hypothetical protein
MYLFIGVYYLHFAVVYLEFYETPTDDIAADARLRTDRQRSGGAVV